MDMVSAAMDEYGRAKATLQRIVAAIKEYDKLAKEVPQNIDQLPSLHLQKVYKDGWMSAYQGIKAKIGDLTEWEPEPPMPPGKVDWPSLDRLREFAKQNDIEIDGLSEVEIQNKISLWQQGYVSIHGHFKPIW